jgi:hypothetical protein
MGKPYVYSHQKSQENVKEQILNTQRQVNQIWNKGGLADMFRKPTVYISKTGVTTRRLNHVATSSAYRTLASAAGAHLMQTVGGDMDKLRIGAPLEVNAAPLLPTFSKGTILLLNSILISYAQQIVGRAEKVRVACEKTKKHAKISAKAMRLAALAVEANVFDDTNHATHASYTPTMPRRKTGGAKKSSAKKAASDAVAVN